MFIRENGVLVGSTQYFYTCTKTAKEMYLYPLILGKYICDRNYVVNRHSFDSFMLIYVHSGSGYVMHESEEIKLNTGNIVLLDCYSPHIYGTHTNWEIMWIHFDGILARKYYDEATEERFIFELQNPRNCTRNIEKMLSIFNEKRRTNEALFNKYLVDIMTELIVHCTPQYVRNAYDVAMEDILTYIAENIEADISIDLLAKRANLSNYHFIRLFKKEIGFTPYAYLLRVRIQRVKFYLRNTNYSLREIAELTGFRRESSLCAAFKKAEGISLGHYRKQESQK